MADVPLAKTRPVARRPAAPEPTTHAAPGAPAEPPASEPVAAVEPFPAPAPRERRPWSFYRLLLVVTPLFAFLGLSLFVGFDHALLLSEEGMVPLVVFAVGLLVAVPLLFTDRGWLQLTAGIVLVLLPVLLVGLFHGWASLGSPLQGTEFTSGWVLLLVFVLALPAGIQGFRAHRRGRTVTIAEGFAGRHGTFVLLVLFLVAGLALAGTLASEQAADADVGAGYDFDVSAVDGQRRFVRAEDFEFRPKAFTVPADTVIEIVAENEDAFYHTFTYRYRGEEFRHELLAGETVRFLVVFDEPGTVRYRCEPHSSDYDDEDGMVGVINVA